MCSCILSAYWLTRFSIFNSNSSRHKTVFPLPTDKECKNDLRDVIKLLHVNTMHKFYDPKKISETKYASEGSFTLCTKKIVTRLDFFIFINLIRKMSNH